VSADTSWQGRAGEGFDVCAFAIDWQAQHATCPQGKVSTGWRPRLDHHGTPVVRIRFRDSDCGPCPVRARCTQRASGGRALDVRQQQEHEVLQQARREQATPEWKQQYDRRAGIEGSISDAVCDHGLRRTRYRGLAKTHLKHLLTAAAINLTRVDAWHRDFLVDQSMRPPPGGRIAQLRASGDHGQDQNCGVPTAGSLRARRRGRRRPARRATPGGRVGCSRIGLDRPR
jgi:hypothetical protein